MIAIAALAEGGAPLSVFKLSMPQLEKHIRALAADEANVTISSHARQRMADRDIQPIELFECLRKGRIRQPAEPDFALGSLECRMECFVAGRTVVACVAVSDDYPDTIVVTVMTRN